MMSDRVEGPVDDEETRVAPSCRRLLGYQIFGEEEVEFVGSHEFLRRQPRFTMRAPR